MDFLSRHGVIIGAALFVLACGFLFVQPEPRLQNKLDLSPIPAVIPDGTGREYVGEDVDVTDVPIEEQLAPQAFMMRDYKHGSGYPVLLCLVYNYARRSRSFHDPYVCYPAQGYVLHDLPPVTMRPCGQEVTAYRMIAEKNESRSYVVYWYMSGGRAVEERGGKQGFLVEEVRKRLRRDLGVTNMVRVSTPINYTDEEAFERLSRFLDIAFCDIMKVKADVGQTAMPAARLWNGGAAGKLGVVAALVLPLTLSLASLVLLRGRKG